jgi:hypothetical protein
VADHVQMAIGHGIEGAWIERDTGQGDLPERIADVDVGALARPGRPRKTSQFQQPVVPTYSPVFHRPGGDETNGAANETIFCIERRHPETGLSY